MAKSDISAVVDLAKYLDQRIRVRFQGGREIDGLLKGKLHYIAINSSKLMLNRCLRL
jgi:small nuclear ribonucleoprotein (snRNP)-like protein